MVVASTSIRPAARCSSKIGRAKGWTVSASVSAASLPASRTCSCTHPVANRTARRVTSIDGRFSPNRS